MFVKERQRLILEYLEKRPDIKIKELAELLHVSEPTIRRDYTELHNRGIITKIYGGAILNKGAPDKEIPFLLRANEKSVPKAIIGRKAANLVSDGMVIMLDGSTSAYHIVPYLSQLKDLIVITSGAKTAVALAEANINTYCTGGYMLIHSFSYVGEPAEKFIQGLNADILFFSCHGLDERGMMSDPAKDESNLRKAMFNSCAKKYLLCDSSKFGKTYLHNIGNVKDIDGIISEKELPENIAKLLRKKT